MLTETLDRAAFGTSPRGALTYHVLVDPATFKSFHASEAVRRISGKTFASQWEYSNWIHGEATEDQLIQVALACTDLYPATPAPEIEPNELVQFDDYREVSPGVWLPFHEVSNCPMRRKPCRARGCSGVRNSAWTPSGSTSTWRIDSTACCPRRRGRAGSAMTQDPGGARCQDPWHAPVRDLRQSGRERLPR